MPTYIDSEGKRFWFEHAPDWSVVRGDLVLTSEPEAAAPDEPAPDQPE